MTDDDFKKHVSDVMQNQFADVTAEEMAVAVSGGADSMALCAAMSEYFASHNILALTVDHDLRTESGGEAKRVREGLKPFENIEHVTLKWQHDEKPESRVQERARNARYDLMFEEMKKQGRSHLFLGHHMNDQAETFLFRLAKGSGLDGLSCMAARQEMENELVLCRPFLSIEKKDLIEYCHEKKISFIDDPSNEDDTFARVRLRRSMDVLSEEGLTPKRLATTAARLSNARDALEYVTQSTFDEATLIKETNGIVLKLDLLRGVGFEVLVRIVFKSIAMIGQKGDYGPRMEKVETLCEDVLKPNPFRKRTLGGVIFEIKAATPDQPTLHMTAEELE